VTIPTLKEITGQAPWALCEVTATNVNRTLIINRDKPPFDNLDLRRAMALGSTGRASSTSLPRARAISARPHCHANEFERVTR